ncbi:MAG: hypothetical protein L6R42_001695 [Xanthoria sp. 1 TBL-2021]|nr:MAG: hypothetical protein L6R42_001695 [Xanthoria sp. 1 TBL-2021]
MATSSDTSILNHQDSLTDGQQPIPNGDAPTNGIATNTTTSSSTTPPSGPPNKAKSLSCGTCRERKVRCDKNQPCSTCQRAKVPCVFPSAKRLPRKRQGERKKTNEKLLQRLNRLEALVEKAGLDEKDGQAIEKKTKQSSVCTPTHSSPEKFSNGDALRKKRERSETSQSSGSQPGGGKTALEGEMSRYLGSNFWANLSDEVEGLRLELNQTSDDDIKEEVDTDESAAKTAATPFHPSQQLPSRNGFVFNFSTPKIDLRFLHPNPFQIENMCNIYLMNVDPINRILHKPTLRKFITGAKDHLDTMPGGSKMQALMFAMYFAAITSLTPEECMKDFGEQKTELLARYRYGTEQALVQADILNSMEMVTLQALVIYLICIRCHDDSRVAWTLTSIAIRIAHALDLHRDDSFASLSPFNTEMRRRLWWQIIILDGRAAEDRGSDPMITEQSYNTMMPSNVNDEDIDPEKTQDIVSREGYTEMTFCLICHEVSVTIRQLNYVPPGLSSGTAADSLPNRVEKDKLVNECHERLESKYLQYCDISVPLSWATSMVTRMIMARMWLIVHKPLQRQEGEMSPRNTDHERVLSTATEVIEFAHILETEPCAEKWRWFFGTWHQWYALAMALAELCNQPHGPIADRAWQAVDRVFDPWAQKVADSQNGGLWRPIKKLRNKARNARDGKNVNDVAMTDPLLHFNIGSQVVPPSFGDPLLGNMPDYPMASLEAGADGLLPSSSGSQGLLGTPLSRQIDLNQWAVNEQSSTPSQCLAPSGEQFNWAGWDDFMRASQREESSGLWGPQMGTWWQ